MIVAKAIVVTPNILTNPVLAQTGTETQSKTNGGNTGGGNTGGGNTGGGTTGKAAYGESALYDEFQSLRALERQGLLPRMKCFIEAGYTGAGDDKDNKQLV